MGGPSAECRVIYYCMCGHVDAWSRVYNPKDKAPEAPKTIKCSKCNEKMLQSKKETEMQRSLAEMYQHQ